MTEPTQLGRAAKPFATVDAAHAVVKAAEALNWNLADTQAFVRQAQHVEYGLSAEIEFAAILRWLGWCRFVHLLNEDALKEPGYDALEVPDLFAVFTVGDKTCTALIEVKTGNALKLKFKKSYLGKLSAYAELMHQPLLIAWRPRQIGFWMLFDPKLAEPLDDDHVQVSFDLAGTNDLMSILAGDYFITPKEGAGLRFEYERIGEKQPTPEGYQARFRVSDAYFHDAAGVRADVPNSIVWMIFSALRDHQEVRDDTIVQSFLASGGGTRAQLVLRTAVGFSLKEDERVRWKQVARNLDAILKCDELLKDAEARFGTFVQYIIDVDPKTMPSFLPTDWRRRSPKPPS